MNEKGSSPDIANSISSSPINSVRRAYDRGHHR